MMTVRSIAVAGALLGLLSMPALAAGDEAPKAKYVGAGKCNTCHGKKTGDQYGQWLESKHAKAFETLAGPAALEAGKEAGVAKPQESPRCLKCHVTAYGADASLIDPKGKYAKEDGVQCESCHGPGSLYKKRKIMKDHEASLAAGLVIPDEQTCLKCHNEESPMFKGFNYEEKLKKIIHPIPETEAPADG